MPSTWTTFTRRPPPSTSGSDKEISRRAPYELLARYAAKQREGGLAPNDVYLLFEASKQINDFVVRMEMNLTEGVFPCGGHSIEIAQTAFDINETMPVIEALAQTGKIEKSQFLGGLEAVHKLEEDEALAEYVLATVRCATEATKAIAKVMEEAGLLGSSRDQLTFAVKTIAGFIGQQPEVNGFDGSIARADIRQTKDGRLHVALLLELSEPLSPNAAAQVAQTFSNSLFHYLQNNALLKKAQLHQQMASYSCYTVNPDGSPNGGVTTVGQPPYPAKGRQEQAALTP